ncbi:DUF3953 domain-containing protein [Oceanobacillus rekensis]|uniref:DUF3953 domain-containing protein n=1 Tax=Oceanobacillus rekensis TaxID=937927 RepID=UPI000B43D43D|nr:DUF3953 domain-containing protein [Oceanobacillus rekensis]
MKLHETIFKITLAISVIALSILGQIIDGMNLTSIMLFLLGALLLTMGAEEIKKEKKSVGYLLVIVAFFNFLVSIQDLFLS